MKENLKKACELAITKIGKMTKSNDATAKKKPGWVFFMGLLALSLAFYLGFNLVIDSGDFVVQWVIMTIQLSFRILWLTILAVVIYIGLRAINAACATFLDSDDSKKASPPVDPNPFDSKS